MYIIDFIFPEIFSAYCLQREQEGAMNSGSNCEIGEPSSHSSRIHYIPLRKNTLGKDMNPSCG